MTERPGDHDRVRALLGREPLGGYDVVVRDAAGDPVVLRNAPLLDDGTPMPTRYWLIGPSEVRRIGRLESAGGVDRAEADVGPEPIAEAHVRYAAERDAAIPDDHVGPRPSGGVGGTRVGVKCLHAHWAWHLAGGDDPVGRWIEAHVDATLAEPADEAPDPLTAAPGRTIVHIDDEHLGIDLPDGGQTSLPLGVAGLTSQWLREHDPARPEALTNVLGIVADHLDDLLREHPAVAGVLDVVCAGGHAVAFARLEAGVDRLGHEVIVSRIDAEEVFRLIAAESAAERAENPGLPFDAVDTIVATCCIVVAIMRHLHLDHVTVRAAVD